MGVYEGGVTRRGKVLHPDSSGDSAGFKPNPGPSEIATANGGPGVNAGPSNTNFQLDSAYKAGPESDLRPTGAMKITDLNNVTG